ncbi:MAG TPA: hypothetical protein VF432_27235 [Thermoanaerobaculia bacterium]
MNRKMMMLFLALAVLAVPALAATITPREISTVETAESTHDLGRYLDNPCTAVIDRIWVNYSVYLQQEFYDDNGRYIFAEDTAMGGTYAASGTSKTDVAYQSPLQIRKYHKVNTNDNFHVVTVIEFNPATRYTSVVVETACGNGMPDSKE